MGLPSLQPNLIAGELRGLTNNVKPMMLPDQAFPVMENAYCFRERIVKREGIQLIGRLRRIQTAVSAGNYTTINGTNTLNLFTGLGVLSTEPDAELQPGTSGDPITIVFGAPISQTLTDTLGTGQLTITGSGPIQFAFINYATGIVNIRANAALGPATVTLTASYYPTLPTMGIIDRETVLANDEQTVYFDTKYAYIVNGGQFQEWIPGTTWSGDNFNLFWSTNYRGVTPDIRLLFVTNFVNNATNPIRYTDGNTWTNFVPAVAGNPATFFMTQAKILIPYYGRLVALNVWEAPADMSGNPNYGSAVNYTARCRFSQIGDPTDQTNGWRSDVFGRGGLADAPTSEAIVSAAFFKNTLIVQFERSTWQLRYMGEYGAPFLWERISSDFGSDSTFSNVLFNDGVLTIGDKAITSGTAVSVDRIDLDIPDQVFDFKNTRVDRVCGVRNFEKELVFWCYCDSESLDVGQIFPNKVLVYNYRNNTWAIFDDRVTCFGTTQKIEGITWDSLTTFWEDMDVTWDSVTTQSLFPAVSAGNSQGYIYFFASKTADDPSYSIQGINLSTYPIVLDIPNHTLSTDDIIQITGMQFIDSVTGTPQVSSINDDLYIVTYVDNSHVSLERWNGTNYVGNFPFTFTPGTSNPIVYVGGGQITFFPVLNVQTKDFNPYQSGGKQVKLAYIDFLTDTTPSGVMTIQILLDSSNAVIGNLLTGNQEVETSTTPSGYITGATQANPCVITAPNHGLRTGDQIQISNVLGLTQINNISGPFPSWVVTYINANTFAINTDTSSAPIAYISGGQWSQQNFKFFLPASQYAWHRFYATCVGQYIRIIITYDDLLMNDLNTHEQSWTLNAINFWTRPGGNLIF